jgi:hypothetical protein
LGRQYFVQLCFIRYFIFIGEMCVPFSGRNGLVARRGLASCAYLVCQLVEPRSSQVNSSVGSSSLALDFAWVDFARQAARAVRSFAHLIGVFSGRLCGKVSGECSGKKVAGKCGSQVHFSGPFLRSIFGGISPQVTGNDIGDRNRLSTAIVGKLQFDFLAFDVFARNGFGFGVSRAHE